MPTFSQLLYETPEAHIARIVLNRPQARNAQDTRMLYELNDALDFAAQDDAIKVIIVAANGPHFSSGHDLREKAPRETQKEFRTVTTGAASTATARKPSSPGSRRSISASANAGATCRSPRWWKCRAGSSPAA